MADKSAFGRAGRLLADLTPGAVVAGYRLEARIGAGGMAVVFRARDERLGRTVALKVLAPALAGDGEFHERFIRESRAAAAVDHPHIIPVYGAGQGDGILYLAMRYVSSGDLRAVMDREGPLRAERAAFLLSPIASALDAAHAAGLVHRDVKPANVLVDMSMGRPDHPYLSDFGLVKGTMSATTGLTGTGQFLGTADYAAPEQITGQRAYVQTDQYALACVAFTMLTGSLPFARAEVVGVLWAQVNDPPPSATARRPGLSPAVDQVLGRALAKNPTARYPSCGAFADALRAALGVGPYSVPGPAGFSAPAYPWQPAPGTMPLPAPVAGGPVVGGPVDADAGDGTSPAGTSRLSTWPGRRRRGALVAAVAAVLTGVAVVVAVLLYPGSAKPQQGSTGSPAAARQTASSPDTGQTGSGAVKGPPVAFPDPGSVPAVAAGFQVDGSLVTVGVNDTAYIWDMPEHQVSSDMAASRGHEFVRAAFSPDGESMIAQDSSGVIYIFQGLVTQPDSTLQGGGDRIYPGSLATAGFTVATQDAARTGVDVWEGPATSPVATMIDPDRGAHVTSVALSPASKYVTASDNSGRTFVWDANTTARLHVLRPADGSDVNCSAFSWGGGQSSDDSLLVTGDSDGRVYLWDAATGALMNSVRNPSGSVDKVAVGFDGDLIATAGASDTIYLWDGTTGASLGAISDPGSRGVNSLAFNAENSQLAVVDKNGTTYVWTFSGR